MLTIEEKIRQLEAIAESGDKLYADYEEHGLQDTHGARRAKSLIEEKRQEIAWLRELVERRKAPEIVFCKDCRKHNVKVGFDENFHTVWKEDACPLVDWRGKAKEHEFDYQYCAFAERRTDV